MVPTDLLFLFETGSNYDADGTHRRVMMPEKEARPEEEERVHDAKKCLSVTSVSRLCISHRTLRCF